jgi:hypothetical protein
LTLLPISSKKEIIYYDERELLCSMRFAQSLQLSRSSMVITGAL